MNSQEFLHRFNVLYNNVSSNQAPGLNTYEISVLLTKAQNELVKNYFLPVSNPKQLGFDDTEKRQRDFSNIIRTKSGILSQASSYVYDPRAMHIAFYGDDVLLILNEEVLLGQVIDDNFVVNEIRQVKPLSYEEYSRLMSQPYKEPLKNQAWRLITSFDSIRPSQQAPEISAPGFDVIIRTADKNKYNLRSNQMQYLLRYVKKLRPIILDNFTETYGENISIDGYTGNESDYDFNNPCELDDSLHEEVLQRAVELAKVAWANDQNETQLTITAGQRSE